MRTVRRAVVARLSLLLWLSVTTSAVAETGPQVDVLELDTAVGPADFDGLFARGTYVMLVQSIIAQIVVRRSPDLGSAVRPRHNRRIP